LSLDRDPVNLFKIEPESMYSTPNPEFVHNGGQCGVYGSPVGGGRIKRQDTMLKLGLIVLVNAVILPLEWMFLVVGVLVGLSRLRLLSPEMGSLLEIVMIEVSPLWWGISKPKLGGTGDYYYVQRIQCNKTGKGACV
jgi:hypothetical protein